MGGKKAKPTAKRTSKMLGGTPAAKRVVPAKAPPAQPAPKAQPGRAAKLPAALKASHPVQRTLSALAASAPSAQASAAAPAPTALHGQPLPKPAQSAHLLQLSQTSQSSQSSQPQSQPLLTTTQPAPPAPVLPGPTLAQASQPSLPGLGAPRQASQPASQATSTASRQDPKPMNVLNRMTGFPTDVTVAASAITPLAEKLAQGQATAPPMSKARAVAGTPKTPVAIAPRPSARKRPATALPPAKPLLPSRPQLVVRQPLPTVSASTQPRPQPQKPLMTTSQPALPSVGDVSRSLASLPLPSTSQPLRVAVGQEEGARPVSSASSSSVCTNSPKSPQKPPSPPREAPLSQPTPLGRPTAAGQQSFGSQPVALRTPLSVALPAIVAKASPLSQMAGAVHKPQPSFPLPTSTASQFHQLQQQTSAPATTTTPAVTAGPLVTAAPVMTTTQPPPTTVVPQAKAPVSRKPAAKAAEAFATPKGKRAVSFGGSTRYPAPRPHGTPTTAANKAGSRAANKAVQSLRKYSALKPQTKPRLPVPQRSLAPPTLPSSQSVGTMPATPPLAEPVAEPVPEKVPEAMETEEELEQLTVRDVMELTLDDYSEEEVLEQGSRYAVLSEAARLCVAVLRLPLEAAETRFPALLLSPEPWAKELCGLLRHTERVVFERFPGAGAYRRSLGSLPTAVLLQYRWYTGTPSQAQDDSAIALRRAPLRAPDHLASTGDLAARDLLSPELRQLHRRFGAYSGGGMESEGLCAMAATAALPAHVSLCAKANGEAGNCEAGQACAVFAARVAAHKGCARKPCAHCDGLRQSTSAHAVFCRRLQCASWCHDLRRLAWATPLPAHR